MGAPILSLSTPYISWPILAKKNSCGLMQEFRSVTFSLINFHSLVFGLLNDIGSHIFYGRFFNWIGYFNGQGK